MNAPALSPALVVAVPNGQITTQASLPLPTEGLCAFYKSGGECQLAGGVPCPNRVISAPRNRPAHTGRSPGVSNMGRTGPFPRKTSIAE